MAKCMVYDSDPLLLTAASVIAERVSGMQQAVDRISELVMERNRPMPEMVVAFQAFDRINQEFAAVADLLKFYAAAPCQERAAAADAAIRAIPLSHLKSLFLESVSDRTELDEVLALGAAAAGNDKVF